MSWRWQLIRVSVAGCNCLYCTEIRWWSSCLLSKLDFYLCNCPVTRGSTCQENNWSCFIDMVCDGTCSMDDGFFFSFIVLTMQACWCCFRLSLFGFCIQFVVVFVFRRWMQYKMAWQIAPYESLINIVNVSFYMNHSVLYFENKLHFRI